MDNQRDNNEQKILHCDFCRYKDSCRIKFNRHFKLASCRQARSILFCCKLCDYIAHSFAEIRKHECKKLRFEYNEMQRLRSEVKHSISSYIMTTCAEEEWYKMNINLNIVRNGLKNDKISLEELTIKSNLTKCKELGLPINIVFALLQHKKWLREEAPGLPYLSVDSIVTLKRNNTQERFFQFTMHRECDVIHYFKLLFAKADAAYWPFCLPNSKIVQYCFTSPSGYCPLARRDDAFYVHKTTSRLQSVLLELCYTNWSWAPTKREDLYRFIHAEWIFKHFKNIVIILDKTPGFLSANETYQDRDHLKEKFDTIYPYVLEFIRFWSKPDLVLESISEVAFIDAVEIDIECLQLECDFENVIKLFGNRKHAASWKTVMQLVDEFH